MDTTFLAILVSFFLSIITLIFGYAQWRRDVKIKLNQIQETVSVELIRQRIEPYSKFYKQLEILSSIHEKEIQENSEKINEVVNILQENVYGKVGLIASHETRILLLYVRAGCKKLIERKIEFSDLRLRLWALHFSLRSDLGISQLSWLSEVERIRNEARRYEKHSIAELVETYPWDNVFENQISRKNNPN